MSFLDNGFPFRSDKCLHPDWDLEPQYPTRYHWNSEGFRCDEFDLDTDASVVFLGCSITVGVSVQIEDCFAHRLWTKLVETSGKNIPYWNLGVPGASISTMNRLLYHWEERLKPKLVIALFPSPRSEEYILGSSWQFLLPNVDSYSQRVYENNPWFTQPNVIQYETHKNMAMIDLVLQKNRSRIFWDSWDLDFPRRGMYRDGKLKCFGSGMRSWGKNLEYDTGFDGIHPGPLQHKNYIEVIWKRFGDQMLAALDD